MKRARMDHGREAAERGACFELGTFLNRKRDSLDGLLAEDCLYLSQTREEELEGREALAAYLGRWAAHEPRQTFAELAETPLEGRPCLLMYVRDSYHGRPGLGEVRSFLELELDEQGLIEVIHAVSFTPSPWHCVNSGHFPGLTDEELAREREGRGVGSFRHIAEPGALVLARGASWVRLWKRHASLQEVEQALVELLLPADEDSAEPRQPRRAAVPDYFAPPASEQLRVLRRIKGTFRRDMLKQGPACDPSAPIPEEWGVHNAPLFLREILGRMDPALRGGEDLPDLEPGEVEIARLMLCSVHCEVTSLRARPLGDSRYTLRMVGECEGEWEPNELPATEYERPLTSEQVVRELGIEGNRLAPEPG